MNSFWEIVASNSVIAAFLAIGVMLLGRVWKNAAAVHLLWVIVLLKLFTPPLVTAELPLVAGWLARADVADSNDIRFGEAFDSAEQADPVAMTSSRVTASAARQQPLRWNRLAETGDHRPWSLSAILAAIWICGSCLMAIGYAVRIRRFASLVRDAEPPPASICAMVAQLAAPLGLKRTPGVRMTPLALPPLVWSLGVCTRLILPARLFDRLSGDAQAAIVAHELAHVRRGDHLVRLLELAATTIFWWHPAVWCARRQLRELEEQCCDGRVLELMPRQERTYAAALVDTFDFLSAEPRVFIPLRTAVYSTGSLSRRIRMLAQNRTNRLNAWCALSIAAIVAAPLAVAFAAAQDQAAKSAAQRDEAAGGSPAILAGRVTSASGEPLAEARVRVAIPAADMRHVDSSTRHKQLETKTDANGDYRLEIPELTEPTTISIDAMKPGYRRLVGTLRSGGDARKVEMAPGATAEAALALEPALYFAGVVVDEKGSPIPGVKITAYADFQRALGGVEISASGPDGSFELFNYPVTPFAKKDDIAKGNVDFSHPNYVSGPMIEDVYDIAEDERASLRIVLPTGNAISGTVLDDAGKPVANAVVKAMRDDGSHRKGTKSDASGRFTLKGLADGPTTLSARSLEIKQKSQQKFALDGDKVDLEVRLQPISLPADIEKHTVLGMQLADVTPELQSAYDLFPSLAHGALILDPGTDSDRLRIGKLAEGYNFFFVGDENIGSVSEFVNQVLAKTAGQDANEYKVRVIYTFSTPDLEGANTQYMRLTKDDIAELRALSDQLKRIP